MHTLLGHKYPFFLIYSAFCIGVGNDGLNLTNPTYLVAMTESIAHQVVFVVLDLY